MSIAAAVFVVYASLVPLRYVPKPLDEVVAQFEKTPWFQLGIERRADWVANGLIMIPAGFCACGAVDWRRRRRWPLVLASPLIISALVALVFGIEFVQIWFPPRVVSQNDIFAGVVGSFGGVMLWWFAGRFLMEELDRFCVSPPGIERWSILMGMGTVSLCLYNLMPLDLLFSIEEFQIKSTLNRFVWIPFTDFEKSVKWILFAAIATLRMAPLTFCWALRYSMCHAIKYGLIWAVILEVVKIPVYSRAVSTTDVALGAIGVCFTAWLAPYVFRLIQRLDCCIGWFFAATLWSGVMLLGFLGRFDQVISDPVVIMKRLHGILAVPFARAHASSEFEAGENILLKLAIFATLSFFLAGWHSRTRHRSVSTLVIAILWCTTMIIGIEIGQVFLQPLIPDITDIMVYTVAALAGLVAFKLMVPSTSSASSRI